MHAGELVLPCDSDAEGWDGDPGRLTSRTGVMSLGRGMEFGQADGEPKGSAGWGVA